LAGGFAFRSGLGGVSRNLRTSFLNAGLSVADSLDDALGDDDMTWRTLDMGDALRSFPDEARMVGEIIAAFNDLEDNCASLLGVMLGNSRDLADAIYRAVKAPQARIDIFTACGRHYFRKRKAALAAFDGCTSEVNACWNIRNVYGHGIYATDQKRRLRLLIPKFGTSTQRGSPIITMKRLQPELARFTNAGNLIFQIISAEHRRRGDRWERDQRRKASRGRPA
jgi:hypothetical protein